MSRTQTPRAGVVAITFHERGGGIAAVSRLSMEALRSPDGSPPRSMALTDQPRGLTFATSFIDRAWFGARVATAQATRGCDWLLFTHLSLAVVQRAIPAWARVPYAVFLHDVEAWQALSPIRTHVLSRAFVRLANSEYTARRVAEANPSVGPIVACPLALSPEWSRFAAQAPAAMTPPSRTVLIVGRMVASERYKGHDQLLEAWPDVIARAPDARLVCVGEGDDVGRLRQKAAALGVGARVDFPGFVDDETRRGWYARAAVFAMPSRREGFGLVYLEAMAAGLPCVGSIHDAAPGVIVPGKTGYLVDQGDVGELSARVVALLQHEDGRRAMGEAGRRRVLTHFTFDAFARRLNAAIAVAQSARAPMSLADARHHGL
ncbi:MAG: glycosyltransferase family 4 protein [Acidobacteriota bacterium]